MEYALVIIIGLVIGSFLNVCIYRIPREESISYPPSHCSTCNHKLNALDLVPIFSYIFLKGKCRYCKDKISLRYPSIELLNALLYLFIYINYDFTLDFFKYCIFTSLLIVIAMIDYNTQDVYTSSIIFGGIVGVAFTALGYILYKNELMQPIFGAIIGFGIIALIVILTKGMGDGDAEIALICGLFLGVKGVLLTLFLGIIIGGIIATIILAFKLKNLKDSMAFGPCLAIGALITMLWGNGILSTYLSLFI